MVHLSSIVFYGVKYHGHWDVEDLISHEYIQAYLIIVNGSIALSINKVKTTQQGPIGKQSIQISAHKILNLDYIRNIYN